MKSYQINIFATKGSRITNELSCVTKARSKKEAKEIAESIISDNKYKYDSVKLQSIDNL